MEEKILEELKEIKEMLRTIVSNTEHLRDGCYSSVDDVVKSVIDSYSINIDFNKKSSFDDESCLECMNDIVQSMLKKYEEQ